MEVVGTALGDGVDGTSRETSLTNVIGSHVDLNLLYGLHTDGLGSCLTAIATARGETEDVVVHGTVDLERVVAVVGSGKRHRARHSVGGDLGIQTRDVGNAMTHGRHVVNHLRADALGGSCLRGIQSATTGDDHLVEHLSILLKRARKVLRLTQQEVHVVESLGLVAHIGDFHLIGASDTHTLNGVAAFGIGYCPIDGA